MANINIQLRVPRIIKNLTQEDLANKAGSSQIRISLLERGLAQPTLEEAARIAAVLGSKSEEIFPKKE